MVVARGFSSRPMPLGLDADLSLRGGDRSALRRLSTELGFGWQDALLSIIGEAVGRASAGISPGLDLPPMLLTGPVGVGRTHMVRRLARLADLPHVLLDLTHADAVEQLGQRPRGPDLVLPALPVLAMAASRCANPIVSVVGVDKLAPEAQRVLAAMIDPATAGRWVDDAAGGTVDLRAINWMVQSHAPAAISPPLLRHLEQVNLRWPSRDDMSFHFVEVLAEAADDEGRHDLGLDEVEFVLEQLRRASNHCSTARLYQVACDALRDGPR